MSNDDRMSKRLDSKVVLVTIVDRLQQPDPDDALGTPEQITDAAVFLCSNQARYVHGRRLNIVGGFREAGLMFKRDTTPA